MIWEVRGVCGPTKLLDIKSTDGQRGTFVPGSSMGKATQRLAGTMMTSAQAIQTVVIFQPRLVFAGEKTPQLTL